MHNSVSKHFKYPELIRESGKTIYNTLRADDPEWIPTVEMQELLSRGLVGLSLAGLPLRTRSRVVKTKVCEILGYPVPSSFKRIRPRFPGQMLDVYIQKSHNLQIWNEEISLTRRYAILEVNRAGEIVTVKVVTGSDLVRYDTTGTLTQKYQARINIGANRSELVS